MKKCASIQQTLVESGFTIGEENFFKDDIKIPFSELEGHTVDSFIEKARRREWFKESGSDMTTPLLFSVD